MAKAIEGRPRALEARGSRQNGTLERAQAWMLSAPDLTFLWEECPRCFYKKVVLKQRRPQTPFPKVFGAIDRAMKDFYLGERAEILAELFRVIAQQVEALKGEPADPDRAQFMERKKRIEALLERIGGNGVKPK